MKDKEHVRKRVIETQERKIKNLAHRAVNLRVSAVFDEVPPVDGSSA
jgi:hypothetical protein